MPPAAPEGMQPSLMDSAQPPIQQRYQQQIPQQPMEQPPMQQSNQYPPQQEFTSMPPAPAYEEYPQQQYQEEGLDYREQIDEIEALIESIVDEKWQAMTSNIGDLNLWKQTIRKDVQSVKQEILRMQARVENLEKAIMGKIAQYDKNISNVGSEIKAMEMVLQKVMQPMTDNIKELQKITTKLKKKK